ncbi:MAG: DUF58 domain-containing protein [Candidatus Cloacimonetes bacterium]|nr:DUF58 domain-containing protein [Candidatus Cloacimonadota bacterium]
MQIKQKIDLSSAKIGFTRAGIYLLLFCLGLMSSSFATGTNILFLLDFFLISVLLFNYIYLKFLAKSIFTLEIPNIIFEDDVVNMNWTFSDHFPMKSKVGFHTKRFTQDKEFRAEVLFFGSQVFVDSFLFPIRGLYSVTNIELEIEFPFPLFVLNFEVDCNHEIHVLPKLHESMTPSSSRSDSLDKHSNEFYQFRKYVAGDSMKKIAWKQYAKTNELMIVEQSSPKQGCESFALHYDDENEKEYFNGVTRFFLDLLQEGKDFLIIGKNSKFKSNVNGNSKQSLLKYLASYEQTKDLKGYRIL